MADHTLSERDRAHLARCVELARQALAEGNDPFGSLLVDAGGTVLVEDHNRVAGGDQTRHPEIAVARWAAAHLDPAARAGCTVYTSGEHCPMCSAAHAWVGLGPVVYASSTTQLAQWREGWGLDPGPVAMLPIRAVAPDVAVSGPDEVLAEQVRLLHAQRLGIDPGASGRR